MTLADIAKPAEARRLVAEAERQLGPIDVLVNNAGIFPRTPFLALTEETSPEHGAPTTRIETFA